MKRIQYLISFVLLLIMACGMAPEIIPTTTPLPEPTSTSTPAPTDTPAPTPTATRDVAATAAAQQTQTAGNVLGELDRVLGETNIPYKEGKLAWSEEKPITVILNGPQRDYVPVDEKLSFRNFVLKSDVTWTASGIIICGAIFRSEASFEQGKQYQFLYMRFSGLPAWSIEFHEFGRPKNSITSVQYSDSINQKNSATNQVMLVAQDGEFTVYINGARQGRFIDYSQQRTEGFTAFLGFQDSGKGKCIFENSWVWELK
jgi:hypothetical protein